MRILIGRAVVGGTLGAVAGASLVGLAWGSALWAGAGPVGWSSMLGSHVNPFVLAADLLPLAGAVLGAAASVSSGRSVWYASRAAALEDALEHLELREPAAPKGMPEIPDLLDGVIVTDAAGTVLQANLALERMTGRTLPDLVGTSIHELLPGLGDEAAVGGRWRRTSRGTVLGRTIHLEARHVDGGTFLTEVSDSVVELEDGNRMIYLLRDLSQDHAAQEELARRDDALEQARHAAGEARRTRAGIYATLSHELLTPLNAVLGYGELVLEDLEDGHTDVSEDVGRIVTNGRRLRQLIQGLLDLGRVEAGREQAFLEWFDVGECLDEAVALGKQLAGERDNVVEVRSTLGPIHVHLDRSKVLHALSVLVENACRFTERGEIVVEARADSVTCGLVFRVTDTGQGIPLVHRHHVFEAFSGLGLTSPRLAPSRSVGLALAQRYAVLMGGTLDLENVDDESGCSFRLELPVDAAQGAIYADEDDTDEGVLELTVDEAEQGENPYDAKVPLQSIANVPPSGRQVSTRRGRRRRTLLNRRLSLPPLVSPIPPAAGGLVRGRAIVVMEPGPSRRRISEELAQDGWWVTACEDAGEAIHLARARRPDLLVVDPVRAVPDLWALRRLPHHTAVAGVPVVLVMGRECSPLRVDDIAAGPMDRQELGALLTRFSPNGGRLLCLCGAGIDPVLAAITKRWGWTVVGPEDVKPGEDASRYELVVADLHSEDHTSLDALVEWTSRPGWGSVHRAIVAPRVSNLSEVASLEVWLDSDVSPFRAGASDIRTVCRGISDIAGLSPREATVES
ncbi:MAG: ATP-binding protein [Myxococcota bacterium]